MSLENMRRKRETVFGREKMSGRKTAGVEKRSSSSASVDKAPTQRKSGAKTNTAKANASKTTGAAASAPKSLAAVNQKNKSNQGDAIKVKKPSSVGTKADAASTGQVKQQRTGHQNLNVTSTTNGSDGTASNTALKLAKDNLKSMWHQTKQKMAHKLAEPVTADEIEGIYQPLTVHTEGMRCRSSRRQPREPEKGDGPFTLSNPVAQRLHDLELEASDIGKWQLRRNSLVAPDQAKGRLQSGPRPRPRSVLSERRTGISRTLSSMTDDDDVRRKSSCQVGQASGSSMRDFLRFREEINAEDVYSLLDDQAGDEVDDVVNFDEEEDFCSQEDGRSDVNSARHCQRSPRLPSQPSQPPLKKRQCHTDLGDMLAKKRLSLLQELDADFLDLARVKIGGANDHATGEANQSQLIAAIMTQKLSVQFLDGEISARLAALKNLMVEAVGFVDAIETFTHLANSRRDQEGPWRTTRHGQDDSWRRRSACTNFFVDEEDALVYTPLTLHRILATLNSLKKLVRSARQELGPETADHMNMEKEPSSVPDADQLLSGMQREV
jgi:hypothetical protein